MDSTLAGPSEFPRIVASWPRRPQKEGTSSISGPGLYPLPVVQLIHRRDESSERDVGSFLSQTIRARYPRLTLCYRFEDVLSDQPIASNASPAFWEAPGRDEARDRLDHEEIRKVNHLILRQFLRLHPTFVHKGARGI